MLCRAQPRLHEVKEPVRIREKRLSDGNISLYLDMYHKGARKKEGLKLYLVPETTSAARMQNSNTRKLAEQIKAQRILDIQQHGLVDCEGIKRSHITLSEWVDKYTAEECGLSKESMRSKRNAQARVEQYLIYIGRHDLALRDVDKDFCKGYIAFLKTCTFNNGKKTLSNTTCRIFVNRLTAALTKAVSEGLIDRNPFKLLDAKEKPQKNSSIREFLTIEEVKQLMATPCRYDIVKRAFLFSCFTGLRYSDIKSLLWSEIRKAADGRTLFHEHPQVKTDFLFHLFVIYSAYEQCYFHKGLLSHPLVNPIMKTGTSGMEQNKSFMSSLTVLSGFMALQRYSRQEMTPKARFL